jgi:translation elongation factor EF-4
VTVVAIKHRSRHRQMIHSAAVFCATLTDHITLLVTHRYIDEERVILIFKLPWQEVVTDFHDKAKNISSGYASFNYR